MFRKRFDAEIANLEPHQIVEDFEEEMKTAKREQVRVKQKGLAGEYRVMYFLLLASSRGVQPRDVIFNPTPGFALNRFTRMKKKTFHKDNADKDEMDVHASSKDPNDMDLIVEVKVWEQKVSNQAVEKFIEQKKNLKLERPPAFLFYSENGFTEKQEQLMQANGVMYTTFKKLVG